jgi:hypothetical protein
MATLASATIMIDSTCVLRSAPRQIRFLTVDGHQLVQDVAAARQLLP